jgi:hypothetical protein
MASASTSGGTPYCSAARSPRVAQQVARHIDLLARSIRQYNAVEHQRDQARHCRLREVTPIRPVQARETAAGPLGGCALVGTQLDITVCE